MNSRVVFIAERCKGCLLCTQVCPKKIIQQSNCLNRQGYKIAEVVAMQECIGCAACAAICPDMAIRVFTTRKAKGADNG